MAEGDDIGGMPELPGGGGGNKQGKDVLKKREYDILDPEAKTKKSANEKIDDAAQTVKNTVKVVQKLIQIPWPVWVVILIIIIVVGIIAFLLTIPGLGIAKIKQIAQYAVDTVQSWFTTSADAYINPDDVVELANYLEELDYDLVGYGFIVPNTTAINIMGWKTYEELKEEGYIYYEMRDDDTSARYYNEAGEAYNGYYYNSLGILIDNSTGRMVDSETYIDQYGVLRSTEETNSNGAGKIVSFGDDWLDKALDINVDTTLLRSYLLSDYRIYAIRNNDEGVLESLWTAIKQTFGGYDSAWSKGLMKFYYAENGLATEEWSSTFDSFVYGDSIKVNGTTLSVTNGHFNNKVTFDIEGWADRYGMSLEFLLSLHVATMAPDLVYAMLQSFDTEVQVYLDDSGESDVEAEYVDMMNANAATSSGITFSDVKETLSEQGGIDLNDWLVNASYYGYSLSSLGISKADAQYLLDELPLESPPNCTGSAEVDVILKSTYKDTGVFSWDNYLTLYDIDRASEFDSNFTLGDEAASLKLEDRDVETDEGDYVDFKGANCTYDLGDDEEEVIENDGYSATLGDIINDDDYKFFYDTGYSLGYTDDSTAVSIETEQQSVDDVYCNQLFDGSVFDIDAVKQVRTWSAVAKDADGNEILDEDGETEEVEYEWTTYKFVIYKVGDDYNVLASGYTELEDGPELVAVVIWEFIIRDKTYEELLACNAIDEDGNATDRAGVCSAVNNGEYGSVQKKCCKNCQKYVKKVVIALAQVTDNNYAFYTPYIARVVGSWFRDTYFVIPDESGIGGDGGESDYRYNEWYDTTYDVSNYDEAVAYNKAVLSDYYIDSDGNLQEYTDNDDDIVDIAIYDYVNESSRSESEMSMIKNSYGSNSTLVIVDEEYLADTGEYWTAYEMQESNPDEYQLYYLNPDGTTSNTKMEDFLLDNGYSSQEEAEEAGHAFVKKAEVREVTDISSANTESDVIWNAYGFDTNGAATGWIKIEREDGNDEVNKVYDIIGDNALNDEGGFYYNITSTNTVTQTEDAQRSETNATVKYLFKYRKYYIYDGTDETAEAIAEDKELVLDWAISYLQEQGYSASDVAHLLGKYGRSALRQTYNSISTLVDWEDVAEQWLSWQLDMYYSGITNDCPEDDILLTDDLTVTINGTERTGDPRNPDLIATVNITKNSLNAFSILENTKTLAAEYSYRDFKELIVELDYFDKEDLSDAISEVFTWILPEVTATGWPIRPWDKQDNDYGALIESAQTYAYLEEIDYEVEDDEEEEEGETDSETTDDEEAENESSSTNTGEVNESKIYYLGDSWINQLNGYTSSFVKSNYINGTDGVTASAYIGENISVASNVEAIVIHLGMNNPTSYGDTQTLIEELMSNNSGIPIYVLAVSHIASDAETTVTNDQIDTYNNEMKNYCNETSGVTYIDPTTDLVGDDGYLKSEYSGTGGYHVNKEGCEVWYNAIVDAIEGSASQTTTSSFEGWEDGDYVTSPVTGKVIEYGTHTRTNVYTEEEEEVGYIVIEAMSSKYFTEDNVAVNSGDTEDLSNADAVEGLNYFYDEYEDTCSGYTILIDGISVDLNLVDESDNRGSYEQNEIYALYDSTEQNKRELQEQAKDDAPFVVVVGDEYEIDNFPTQEEGYVSSDTDDYIIYIKEGKYIGTCVSTYEGTEEEVEETENTTDVDNTETTDETEDTTSDEYDGPAEYIRVMLKNMEDYSIVDNVEDYFNIPEEDGSSSANILPGNTVEEKVWNALIQAGYSEVSAAAAMGNIYQESGFQTNNLENQYEGTYSDETYTSAVDSGSYSKSQFTGDSYGYGLIQWTSSGRKEHLYEETVEKGLSVSDADGQISVLLEELAGTWTSGGGNSDRDTWANASSYSDLYDAVVAYCDGFEGAGVRAIDVRYESAQEYYEKYGSGN